MRVLTLTHNFPRHPGDPVGSFVLRLAVALRDHGVETHVVAPMAPGLPSSDSIEGVPVTRFRYAPGRLETLAYTGTMGTQVRRFWKARLAMVGFLASGYRAAIRAHTRQPADVIHAHWWFPGGLVARAVRSRTGLPYVVTMHGSDIRLAASLPGAARLFRTVSRRAAAMTTVSSWLAAQSRRLDAELEPVVAPMPVAPELFHPGEHRDADRLLFIGKLTEQKGLAHLFHAMTMMRSQPRLDVVGAGRIADSQYRTLARDLGLEGRVTWHPLLTQQELADLYRSAAIHVIPAVDEGLGLTAVEALLSETPVVAFDSGGLPDVVFPDRTGLLVPARDQQALARALDDLLADAGKRQRMGRAGRELLLERFGPTAVAEQYAAILQQAAHSRR
jgi:glycosyltransferase involved in cell wall biosynthesis